MPEPDLPAISFAPDLPISAHRDEIARALAEHQVIIVAGETGSGKTTQLPKIALALGRTSIAHTQPRRIAARTIAERIADELGEPVGQTVGYQVRFTDKVGPNTRIAVMTDGILLNAIHSDRRLERYDTIIIDEAHERSLNIDFLLGYLKQLLPQRPDLKVIITSATIDPESFAAQFGGAPVISVSGRTFPVEIRYRPLAPDPQAVDDDDPDADPDVDAGSRVQPHDLNEGICDALAELAREQPGDVLVFLASEAEIRDAQDAVLGKVASGGLPADTEVLPLFGRLSNAEQHRVFEPAPGRGRRVILATNIAETSLTVPGIRYVIDGGMARISRYSTRSKVQRLPIEAISQASARQRSGRCGRTSDGIAIRLYSRDDFESRPAYTDPEIVRTNLAAVILQMASLRLGAVEDFPFMTPPDSRAIKDGMDLLGELGALTKARTLTKVGRDLSRLPIEPRYARMIVETRRRGNTREVLAIVAGLTVQDVRERPAERRDAADQAHARFADPKSDFLTLLNLWNYLAEKRAELSGSAFRRLCRTEFINYMRVREWIDLNAQLTRMAKQLKLTVEDAAVDPDGIHQSIMSGLLSHLGIRDERSRNPKRPDYRGARGTSFALFPGSSVARKPPEAVMAAELVETSRLFARTAAAIELEWAEPLAGDRVTKTLSEPHWEKKQGAAVAYERVTLYGLPLVERRRMQFARFDAEFARELFIRHALVDGEWESPQKFDRQNRALRARLEQVEARSRRRDILQGDEAIYRFYDQRIPADVASTRDFEGWWRKARAQTPDLLTMTEADLVGDDAEAGAESIDAEYPREWHSGDQKLRLSYRFEPGAEDDGVTVTVPLALLPRFDQREFEESVPGFRLELVTALIRSLPKAIRKHVVPAADYAAKFVAQLEPAGSGAAGAGDSAESGVSAGSAESAESLSEALAVLIARETHLRVTAADFDWSRVPAHLRPTFRVIDDNGRTMGRDKDLHALQKRLHGAAAAAVARLVSERPKVADAVVGAAGGAGAGGAAGSGGARGASGSGGVVGAGSGRGVADSARATAVGRDGAAHGFAERDDVVTWDLGELPRYVDIRRGGATIRAYPALVVRRRAAAGSAVNRDSGSGPGSGSGARAGSAAGAGRSTEKATGHASVDLRVFPTEREQHAAHVLGVRRLVADSSPSPASYVREHLSAAEKLALTTAPYPSIDAVIDDVLLACAEEAVRSVAPDGLIWSTAEFTAARDAMASSVMNTCYDAIATVARVMQGVRDVDRAIDAASTLSLAGPLSEVRAQVTGLVYPGFIAKTGLAQLRRVPVYLQAAVIRVQKMAEDPGRDRVSAREVQQAADAYAEAGGRIPAPDTQSPALTHVRWMLEEFRVSAFAQQLGAAGPISLQRIRKALGEL